MPVAKTAKKEYSCGPKKNIYKAQGSKKKYI